ncbi:MAG: PQQ-dependent sugar dehydrogenase [Candidatus Methylomirabilis sp.]|nr:PQQ-dependent sugar dehydrogenase [Candidatus Methylomirabilis sp.]
MSFSVALIPLLALLALLVAAPATAAIELVPLVGGLSAPVYMTHARDGTGRLFIVEQAGRIRVLHPGATTSTVFLDLSGRVLSGGERGLLGLAFHPQFAVNRRFFVHYTRQPDGATVIAQYLASATIPDSAEPDETVLLMVPQPFANHNGGCSSSAPTACCTSDWATGGSANDPDNRAQNLDEPLGKLLRIDVDPLPYASPPDNPFVGAVPGRDEIYALGLRNPWRFAFDRATGELYVGDVGQGAFEEVDLVTLGGNYGWRVFEGAHCTNLDPARCSEGGFVPPIAEYAHVGDRCSITGGYVYRGMPRRCRWGAICSATFAAGSCCCSAGGADRPARYPPADLILRRGRSRGVVCGGSDGDRVPHGQSGGSADYRPGSGRYLESGEPDLSQGQVPAHGCRQGLEPGEHDVSRLPPAGDPLERCGLGCG